MMTFLFTGGFLSVDRRLFFLALPLLAGSSVFATDYCFIDKDHPWHFETNFSYNGPAEFHTNSVKHTHLKYTEGTTSLYYTGFVTPDNALSAQAGLNFIRLDWDQNPRFKGDNYYYGIVSLAWISTSLEKWRWVLNGGVSFDTRTFNFGQSGVYYALVWGRYQYVKNLALHVGFFGYVGAQTGYMLPVLGLDWNISPKWELKGVFPFDMSLNYHFHKHWTTSIDAISFGGPYRFPRRVHDGIDGFQNGIFEVYSTGVEWDLKFKQKHYVVAGAGAGYDFGGWIFTKDHESHHGRYYKFNGSAYGRLFLNFTF
jgi:hypothetical protein